MTTTDKKYYQWKKWKTTTGIFVTKLQPKSVLMSRDEALEQIAPLRELINRTRRRS